VSGTMVTRTRSHTMMPDCLASYLDKTAFAH